MNDETIKLSDQYTVSKASYECFRQLLDAVLSDINSMNIYTLKMILGENIWSRFDHGERRLLGRCVAHMVTSGILPLVFVESKHEYPKKYQLK